MVYPYYVFKDIRHKFIVVIFLVVYFLYAMSIVTAQTELDVVHIAPESGNGFGPSVIGINPATNRIYIGNSRSENISVIDGSSNKVIDTTTIVQNKLSICPPDDIGVNSNANRIYVTIDFCRDRDTIESSDFPIIIIDGFSNEVVDSIEIEADVNLIAVDSNANLLYALSSNSAIVINALTKEIVGELDIKGKAIGINQLTQRVYIATDEDVKIVDGTSRQVIDSINLSSNAIGIDHLNSKIYVATDRGLKVVDAITNEIIESIDIEAVSIEINNATNKVYAGSDKSISVIDGLNNKLTGSIDISGSSMALNSNANMLYAISGMDVFVVDGDTDEIIDFVTIGALPEDVIVNNATKRVYTLDKFNNKIIIVDEEKRGVVDTIRMDRKPNRFDINKTTNKIYATSVDNSVIVINGDNNAILKNIAVGDNPKGIWVDSKNNVIYTANSAGKDISIIDGTIDEVVGNIRAPSAPLFIGGNERTNRIYVSFNSALSLKSSILAVISSSSKKVIDLIDVEHDVGQIVVNIDTNHVYVTKEFDSVTEIKPDIVFGSAINGLTNKVINTFTISAKDVPHIIGGFFGRSLLQQGIAINTVLNHIYISSMVVDHHDGVAIEPGVVSIIDGADNEIVNIFNVGISPTGIGINQEENIVYISDNEPGDLIVVKGMPGSTVLSNPVSLKVESASAKSSIRFQDVIVTVNDKDMRPAFGVTVTASANGRLTSVRPLSTITGEDGKARFKFRFGVISKGGSITFRAGNESATLSQK